MPSIISENLPAFWFLLGFLLLAVEILAFGFSSGVLLFGSVGALITGALMWAGWLPANWLFGIAAFAVASAASAALLWFPLKRMQSGAELGQDRSSDLIGHTFRLDSSLSHTQQASTRYSGITWRVELSDASTRQEVAAGERVRVDSLGAGYFRVVPDA